MRHPSSMAEAPACGDAPGDGDPSAIKRYPGGGRLKGRAGAGFVREPLCKNQ